MVVVVVGFVVVVAVVRIESVRFVVKTVACVVTSNYLKVVVAAV